MFEEKLCLQVCLQQLQNFKQGELITVICVIYFIRSDAALIIQFYQMHKKMKSVVESPPGLPASSEEVTPPNFMWIYDWKKQFADQVEKPIHMREMLLNRQEPQRCFQHSIVYSIYCTVCRKILCASCMYSSSAHRKHRIVPIENSGDDLKEDIRSFESRVYKITKEVNGIMQTNSDLMLRLDRQFNPLQTSIKKFYEKMRAFLKAKQLQQMNQLKEMRDSARTELMEYNQQLTRFNAFVNSKLQYYSSEMAKTNTVLASRTIMQVLANSSSLLTEHVPDLDKFNLPINEEKIDAVREEIQFKINSMLSAFNKQEVRIKSPRPKTTSIQHPSKANILSVKKVQQGSPFKDIRRNTSSLAALGRTQIRR